MIPWLAAASLAAPWDLDVPPGTSDDLASPAISAPSAPAGLSGGYRIGPAGSGAQVTTGLASVIGPNGGTNAAHVAARYGGERFAGGLRLPFAAYRTQDGRSTDLGNLMVDGQLLIESGGTLHSLGVEAHVNLGGRPWTWVNKAEELWPGGGADAVWQVRTEGPLSWLGRASMGLHGTRGFHPYPKLWTRLAMAGGLDWSASPLFGLTSEVYAAWWDISPLELTALARVQSRDGLRLRAGLLLPIAAWAGATPTALAGGARELTLITDLTLSM